MISSFLIYTLKNKFVFQIFDEITDTLDDTLDEKLLA